MKIETDRATIKDAATIVRRHVSGRSRVSLPALSGVMLETIPGALTLTRTDLERTVRVTVAADVVETGRVLVPADTFAAAVKTGPDRLVIAAEGDRVTVGVSSLRPMVAEDFPATSMLPERVGAGGVTLTDRDRVTLGQVARAASTDDARPVLTGVRFDADGVAATDSYRLAVADLASGLDALVPARFVSAVAGWKTDERTAVRFGVGGSWAFAHGTVAAGPKRARRRCTVMAATRLLEGTFPNWRALWPADADTVATWETDGAALSDALGQLSAIMGGKSNVPATLEPTSDGRLRVSASNSELGDGEAFAPLETVPGEVWPMHFNPRFLADAVGQVGAGSVRFAVREALKPAVLSGDGAVRVLLMPMRVS